MFKTKSTKSCNFSLILSSDTFALKTLPWSMFLGFKNFSNKIIPGNLVWRLIGGGWSSISDFRFQRLIFPEESSNSFPISGSQNSWNHKILLNSPWKKGYKLSNTFYARETHRIYLYKLILCFSHSLLWRRNAQESLTDYRVIILIL